MYVTLFPHIPRIKPDQIKPTRSSRSTQWLSSDIVSILIIWIFF